MIYWSGSELKSEHFNIFLCKIAKNFPAEVFKYMKFVMGVVNMGE